MVFISVILSRYEIIVFETRIQLVGRVADEGKLKDT